MPTPGFIGTGFYTSKLLFGGLLDGGFTNPWVVSSPTNLTADLITQNIVLNNALNVYSGSGNRDCYKIICSGTLTINSGGYVSASANLFNGGNTTTALSSPGLGFGGSVGGSGFGGAAELAAGAAGAPSSPQPVFLGGAGGHGGTRGGDAGGAGGTSSPASINNRFQPSIYEHAGVWVNPAIYADSPSTFTNWAGAYAPGYAMVPVCGGCGGGGCSDIGSNNNGAGGAGGGVVYIAANKIVMNGGSISANGQSAGNLTGGGGGGGGVIILVTNDLVFVPGSGSSITVNKGFGGGLGSTDGGDGMTVLFSDQLVASFSAPLTEIVYKQAVINFQFQGKKLTS
jgi:hypothetical protein